MRNRHSKKKLRILKRDRRKIENRIHKEVYEDFILEDYVREKVGKDHFNYLYYYSGRMNRDKKKRYHPGEKFFYQIKYGEEEEEESL